MNTTNATVTAVDAVLLVSFMDQLTEQIFNHIRMGAPDNSVTIKLNAAQATDIARILFKLGFVSTNIASKKAAIECCETVDSTTAEFFNEECTINYV